jgi:hypothetical protein
MAPKAWGGSFDRWLIARLDEAEPEWRAFYTYSRERTSEADERWLSETTLATAHARLALSARTTNADEHERAEQLIADARAEARRRHMLPRLTRVLVGNPETQVKCEIDERGRLYVPEKWRGWLIRDRNAT